MGGTGARISAQFGRLRGVSPAKVGRVLLCGSVLACAGLGTSHLCADDFVVGSSLLGANYQIWEWQSDNSDEVFARAGASIAVGDIDRDGTDDLLVGANSANFYTGEVYLILGDPDRVEPGPWSLSQHAEIIFTGEEVQDGAGGAIAIGDVNGDQELDILIGASNATREEDKRGAFYIVFGGSDAYVQAKTDGVLSLSDASVIVFGESDSELGSRLVTVGDLNNDGFEDIAVAATGFARGAGRVYLLAGRETDEWYQSSDVLELSTNVFTRDVTADEQGRLGLSIEGFRLDDGQEVPLTGLAFSEIRGSQGASTTYFYSEETLSPWFTHVAVDWSTAAYCVEGSRYDDRLGTSLSFAAVLGDPSQAHFGLGAPQTEERQGGMVQLLLDAATLRDGSSSGCIPIESDAYALLNEEGCAPQFGYQLLQIPEPASYNVEIELEDRWPGLLISAPFFCENADAEDPNTAGKVYWVLNESAKEGGPLTEFHTFSAVGEGQFGSSMAVGNFNSVAMEEPGNLDLVVGAPTRNSDRGAIYIFWDIENYTDKDGDGYVAYSQVITPNYGDPASAMTALDCDDLDESAYPNEAFDPCDGQDSDCDGFIGEPRTFYQDGDGDSFGNPEAEAQACEVPEGFVDNYDDCDDANSLVNPDAEEICGNGINDDCKDGVDDKDADGDDFIDEACLGGKDCDDNSVDGDLVNPDQPERCDGRDTDCSGQIDAPPPDDATVWYEDVDGDGRGNPAILVNACDKPEGFVDNLEDCDDGDPSRYLKNSNAVLGNDPEDLDCDGNSIQTWGMEDEAGLVPDSGACLSWTTSTAGAPSTGNGSLIGLWTGLLWLLLHRRHRSPNIASRGDPPLFYMGRDTEDPILQQTKEDA